MLLQTLIAQFGEGLQPVSPLVEGAAEDPAGNLELIISNILGFFTIVGGIFFIVYFLMASIQWITSGGDSSKLDSARNRMIHGVLGLTLLVAAYGIIGIVGSLIGVDILNPAEMIQRIVPGGNGG
jgi:hypothetical protein